MRRMNEKHIARLESQLERLVEGAFTNLFRKKISTHDIAMKLARSMEHNLQQAQGNDPRPVAPDTYTIFLHPKIHQQLSNAQTQLILALSAHLVELATQSGYRLLEKPVLKLLADAKMAPADVVVHARHTHLKEQSTAAMQAIPIDMPEVRPNNPYLIVDRTRTIQLKAPIINIGRSDENHIVVDDPFISRHHLQIRLRFGNYTLFDVNSRGGTFVNNVRVTEHQLQPHDVIRIGETQIIYMLDGPSDHQTTKTTDSIDPVD